MTTLPRYRWHLLLASWAAFLALAAAHEYDADLWRQWALALLFTATFCAALIAHAGVPLTNRALERRGRR